jgi:TatD DNase family protein
MRLEDLVVETDAPYLTPAPHRGTRNESSYVRFVAAKIAELQGVEYDVVADQTTVNAKRIFGL